MENELRSPLPVESSHVQRSWLRMAAAFAALVAALALLVADSAPPICDDSEPLPFAVYDVKFKCPELSEGRVRLDATYGSSGSWSVEVELVSGDLVVSGVDAHGSCADDGATAHPNELFFTLGEASCSIDLDTEIGITVDCDGHSTDNPCTLKIMGVE